MFEEIMVQKFSELMKDTSLKIQETHKISVGIKFKKNYSRHATIILKKSKYKDKSLQ